MKKWKYSDTTPTLEFEEYYQGGAGTENVGPRLYSLIKKVVYLLVEDGSKRLIISTKCTCKSVWVSF